MHPVSRDPGHLTVKSLFASSGSPAVETHIHIFCWGENPEQGYLSESTRRSWLTRLIVRQTGIQREPGATLSEKLRNRGRRRGSALQPPGLVALRGNPGLRALAARQALQCHSVLLGIVLAGCPSHCDFDRAQHRTESEAARLRGGAFGMPAGSRSGSPPLNIVRGRSPTIREDRSRLGLSVLITF